MADIREALNGISEGGPYNQEDFYSYSSSQRKNDYEEKETTSGEEDTHIKKSGYSFEQELPNISAFETNGSMVDDILRSLQQSSSTNSDCREQSMTADSAVSDWYSCLSDREKHVLERLALFEGRVEALQNMKEELYTSLVGEVS